MLVTVEVPGCRQWNYLSWNVDGECSWTLITTISWNFSLSEKAAELRLLDEKYKTEALLSTLKRKEVNEHKIKVGDMSGHM